MRNSAACLMKSKCLQILFFSDVSWIIKIVHASKDKPQWPSSSSMGEGCPGPREGVSDLFLWRCCFSKECISGSCCMVGKNGKLPHWLLSLHLALLLKNLLASLWIQVYCTCWRWTEKGSLRLELEGKIKQAVVDFYFYLPLSLSWGDGSWGQGKRPWNYTRAVQ